MICAFCGQEAPLTETVWVDGIKQPRPCKKCLMGILDGSMKDEPNDLYWLQQLAEDPQSVKTLREAARKSNG